jgi:hypothetical protein
MKTSFTEKRGVFGIQDTSVHRLTDKQIRISTTPEELKKGLFGQAILYIMEVLPGLYDEHIFPAWEIRSKRYGSPPNYLTIPGVLDVNYRLEGSKYPSVGLREVRKKYMQVLGDDWEYLNMLWNTYFCIPDRVIRKADEFGDLSQALGLHYRGTDKSLEADQTNPVSHNDMLTLTNDYLRTHPEIDTLFIATDESSLVEKMEESFLDKLVLNTGEVTLFWDNSNEPANPKKGDHAMLDCLLLSRCHSLIKCQSALSGFSKVLNPRLKAYRISANKMTGDIPYFPDAYLPKLPTDDPECQGILERLFEDDWLEVRRIRRKFGKSFRTMDRPQKKSLRRFLKRVRG